MKSRPADDMLPRHIKVVLPVTEFNRMCYSYLHNDWVTFARAGFNFMLAIAMMSTGHWNSNTEY